MPRYSRTRYQKDRPAGTLKASVAELVEACGGTVETARLLGKSKSQVQRYTDPEYPDEIPAADVLALELACGRMIVTGYLAHEQSAALLKLPAGVTDGRIYVSVAAVGERISALFGSYGRAIGTRGRVNQRDVGRLVRVVDEALSSLSDLRAHLQVRRNRRRGS